MSDRPPTADLSHLAVFHGELNSQQAHIYARLARAGLQDDCRLRGTIHGPTNRLTRTLAATVTLHDRGPGADLLAGAIMPDPCFWSPGHPYLYDVHIELATEQKVMATESRTLGLRMFGVNAGHFYLESRPWQLLGANDGTVKATDWAAWREAGLVRRMTMPADQQCEQASREGVMLIADIEDSVCQSAHQLERELARLSRHAAVAIATVSDTAVVTAQVRADAPNLLLAQRCSLARLTAPSQWADLVVYETDNPQVLSGHLSQCDRPVLVQICSDDVEPVDCVARRCRERAAMIESVGSVAGCVV